VNIQEYISGGIVESYVLGLASNEERKEFEQFCAQYPQRLEARTAFELALEKQAMENALIPPPGLKDKILSVTKDEAAFVTLPATPVRTLNRWKYAAAACLLLLAGSVYQNVSLTGRNKKLKSNYDTTLAELSDIKKDIAMLTSQPQVKMASLKGTEISPQSYTTVYWDTASHDVYLLTNNLPSPPTDMQYQLWALLDGKPTDLGMLDYDLKQKKLLIRMKNAQQAQAFAITLEKKNRPDTSTPAGEMYVMGKL
jgi:anti-sigma-K factor RskA